MNKPSEKKDADGLPVPEKTPSLRQGGGKNAAPAGRQKTTGLERSWILYDVGNSAFTLLVSTLFPIYFNALADAEGISSVDYLAYWGYATSIVTAIVALLGPILGSLTDTKGFKKPVFVSSMAIGVLACVALGFTGSWLVFLIVFVVAKIGYAASLVFYDSMIHDVTTPERMDDISSKGYAWGYIGSCVPFIISLVLVLFSDRIGLDQMRAMTIAFIINALWWLGCTVPLLRRYRQRHFVARPQRVVRESFARLGHALRSLKKDRQVLLFLLAFFCYIDGVYTIIDMATAYGTALGLDSTGLLLALLLTQLVAFPFALLFGYLSRRFSSARLIPICIAAYTGIAVYAFFLDSQTKFWILAVCVGMFQGGIQALSRSHFAKIIPAEKSGEYFGLYDICGKGASFFGTMLISVASQLTGSVNIGVASLAILFVAGLALFLKSCGGKEVPASAR